MSDKGAQKVIDQNEHGELRRARAIINHIMHSGRKYGDWGDPLDPVRAVLDKLIKHHEPKP